MSNFTAKSHRLFPAHLILSSAPARVRNPGFLEALPWWTLKEHAPSLRNFFQRRGFITM
jgi:hypothetical protein